MKKDYDLNLPISDKLQKILPGNLIDAEKLIRLNPLWIVQDFQEKDGNFHARLKDYSTDIEFELSGALDTDQSDALVVNFTTGDYELVSISPAEDKYTTTVIYSDPDFREESDQERNTVMWLRSIQEYLRLYQKKTINTLFFRYIMNRIVLTMTPSQRKICLMLLRITAVELLVIVIIVIGYVYFVLKPSG